MSDENLEKEKLTTTDTPSSPFQSSIFSQMEELRKQEGLSVEPYRVDQEDLRYFFEMPFDIASSFTSCPDVKLTTKESEQLSKLWKRPIERLAEKYPAIKDLDIYLAATATVGIVTEKLFAYRIYQQSNNNNSGNEGKGKDQLS